MASDAKLNINVMGGDKAKASMKAVGDELTKALARAESEAKNLTKDVKDTAKAFNKASVEADILAKKTQIANQEAKKLKDNTKKQVESAAPKGVGRMVKSFGSLNETSIESLVEMFGTDEKGRQNKYAPALKGLAAGGAIGGAMATMAMTAWIENIKAASIALSDLKKATEEARKSTAETNIATLKSNRMNIARLSSAGIKVEDLQKMGISLGVGAALSKGGISKQELDFAKGAMQAGVDEDTLASDIEGNKNLVKKGLKKYLKSKGIEGEGKANQNLLDLAARAEEMDRTVTYKQIEGSKKYEPQYRMLASEKIAMAIDAEGQARAQAVGELLRQKEIIKEVNDKLGILGNTLAFFQTAFGTGTWVEQKKISVQIEALTP